MNFDSFLDFFRRLGNQGARALHPNLPFIWVPGAVLFFIFSQFSGGLAAETEMAPMILEFPSAINASEGVVNEGGTLLAIPPLLESFSFEVAAKPKKIATPVEPNLLRRPANMGVIEVGSEFISVSEQLQGVRYPLVLYIDAPAVGTFEASGRQPEKMQPLEIGQSTFSLMLLGMFTAPIFSFGVAVSFVQNRMKVAQEDAGGDVHE